MPLIRSPLGKVLIGAGLAGLGYEGYQLYQPNHGGASLPMAQSQVSTVSTMGTPTQPVSGTANVEMTVRNFFVPPAGKGMALIGSHEDYTDPENLTIVLPSRLVKAQNLTEALIGKTIQVSGRRAVYKGRPQIIATSITMK